MKARAPRKGGLIAAFINPTNSGTLSYYDRACLLWNEAGEIEYFSEKMPGPEDLQGYEIFVRDKMIALPGFIDLHTHLPQYEFSGQGAEALLPWLEKYTFPQEARFADGKIAGQQSENFFRSVLMAGTTTVVAYLSSFMPAAEIAFEVASHSGIRAYLGLTLMDRNVPSALLTDTKAAEKNMLSLIQKFHKQGKLEYVVTPRFAISCTAPLLQLCGEISRVHQTFLQTHISENIAEISETLRLFPGAESYAGVYERGGCLHSKTLLGHGIHLTDAERKLIRERESVVVHCPVSNNFLGSGIMPYADYATENLRLGLGTDVAAGYSLSMLHEAKHLVEMAKLKGRPVSADRALYQATLGNAEALGRGRELGSFAVGKRADVAVIDDAKSDTMLGGIKNRYASLSERLNRVLYRGSHDSVAMTLVDGQAVYVRQAAGPRELRPATDGQVER